MQDTGEVAMIIGAGTDPKKQAYYVGALILDMMRNSGDIDLMESFHEIRKDLDVSLKQYLLSLDWLFMLGLIDQKNGRISRCS